ncbi:MAG: glycosyltransferase [Candidatus Omnitrophica bacterium]|nr:glycosyltransferase [Candidatus Omnitrophota bacterium]MDD5512231.1 glycosyltransferase [Candidatus Omnitrophota bacterium]
MTVSIIIAAKEWQKNLEECVSKCRQLDYPDFEIIVLPDVYQGSGPSADKPVFSTGESPDLRVIPTGAADPAKKRDIGFGYARGEILAFIDDDAYPRKDWLKNAIADFADPQVAAVGGPAVTPPEDSPRQKASGAVYSSLLVSGSYVYRYRPRKKRTADDLPSCNLLVRKSVMQELGGFRTAFWPGEDTKLCQEITGKLKKKIIYDPEVFVYHHRRRLFLGHIRQVANYALHRGYFVKRFPATSAKLTYFLPSLLVLGIIIGGVAGLFSAELRLIYLAGLATYLSLVLIFSIFNELQLILLVFPGIITTHLAYGIYFIKGLLAFRLREEK